MLQFPVHIPFTEQLGFELVRLGGGESEIVVALREEHLNSFRVAHGGLTMTLLDVAMSHAARSVNMTAADATGVGPVDHGPGVVTIEMKTSFMRPGQGRLRGTGKLLHRSMTLAFCEGSVFGEDGALCAHATATFKYLRALPTDRRTLAPLQTREPPVSGGSGSD
ncbi:MAG: PaaI family thioesterase [Methylibium sp.]|uniref:PaaI family thioesterase n=1 Tax=Methylibium sp. TaxID=2067992 RepID=UPI0017EF9371|nr:PaaI family thioesterase [Methylibium sp.]MBA3595886.1 PaaI family thioesterase [Methylibium sp.]